MRSEIAKFKGLDHDPNFKWRGEAVTRIENLSDIVFALALGMLISAATPPQSFEDLKGFLVSIIPVTAAFAVLIGIWNHHFTFFRRYGVADSTIIFLNAVLLFVVLYLAYPLRFAFDSFFWFIVSSATGDYTMLAVKGLDFNASGVILGYFGVGFGLIHTLFAFMYQHALKNKVLLDLNSVEQVITRQYIFIHWGTVIVSLSMASIAYFTPLNGMAGFLMCFTSLLYFISAKRYALPKTQHED